MDSYHWLHIPTGKQGLSHFSDHYFFHGVLLFQTEADRLRIVNYWNAQQPTIWKYWV